MDAPVLYRMVVAARPRLEGASVRYGLRAKGPWMTAPVYLLRLQPPGGTLLVSLRPEAPGIVLFREGAGPEGEKDPGAERLGRLLEGRAIEEVAAFGIDRFVEIRCEGGVTARLDLRPPRPSFLVAEEGTIRFVLPGNAKVRPGAELAGMPGAGKTDLAEFDPATLPETMEDEDEARRLIRRSVRAVSPAWLDELFARSRFGEAPPDERKEALAAAWREMAAELGEESGLFFYREGGREGNRPFLSAIPLFSIDEEGEAFDDPLAAAIVWWAEADEAAGREGIVAGIREALGKERKRVARRAEKLRAELEEAERYPLFRKQGEILSIHFGKVKRGAAAVRLPDPYDGGEIDIPLDPAKTPRENVARLFKKAKKGERGVPVIAGRLDEAEKALLRIEELRAEAEEASTPEEAEGVTEKARPYLKGKPPPPVWKEKIRKPKDRELAVHPREYKVAGGYTVLVGKDDRENDLLTTRIARPGDFWFHASQSPGSHVVLLRDDPGKSVPGEALLAAAAIAAHYSKARHASKVPVVYTEKRYVRKPRGWPPGKVTLTREKTLFVEPALPE
ncbi:MAG: NFACT RNA binding domain-containing protein [Candidatus Eisenbacteria bacterium]